MIHALMTAYAGVGEGKAWQGLAVPLCLLCTHGITPPPKTRSDTHVLGLKPLWVVGDEVCGVSLSEVLCKHVLCVYNSSFNKGTWG